MMGGLVGVEVRVSEAENAAVEDRFGNFWQTMIRSPVLPRAQRKKH